MHSNATTDLEDVLFKILDGYAESIGADGVDYASFASALTNVTAASAIVSETPTSCLDMLNKMQANGVSFWWDNDCGVVRSMQS